MLLKLWQKRSKTRLLLLDHGDDYGAELCQECRVSPIVLDPQDRNALHKELIQVGREDRQELKALK